jgi:hypothetical protein
MSYEEVIEDYFSQVSAVNYIQPVESELKDIYNQNLSEEKLDDILSTLGLAYKPDPHGFIPFNSYREFTSDFLKRLLKRKLEL